MQIWNLGKRPKESPKQALSLPDTAPRVAPDTRTEHFLTLLVRILVEQCWNMLGNVSSGPEVDGFSQRSTCKTWSDTILKGSKEVQELLREQPGRLAERFRTVWGPFWEPSVAFFSSSKYARKAALRPFVEHFPSHGESTPTCVLPCSAMLRGAIFWWVGQFQSSDLGPKKTLPAGTPLCGVAAVCVAVPLAVDGQHSWPMFANVRPFLAEFGPSVRSRKHDSTTCGRLLDLPRARRGFLLEAHEQLFRDLWVTEVSPP